MKKYLFCLCLLISLNLSKVEEKDKKKNQGSETSLKQENMQNITNLVTKSNNEQKKKRG